MKKLVLDSSVMVKWLNKTDEDNIKQADAVLKDTQMGKVVLLAPELAKYEIGKALLVNKKLSQTDAKISLAVLFELPVEFIPQSPELARESYAIASAFGLTYNESVFLALTEQRGAVLVTDNVSEQARESGINITALKEY